MRRRFIGTISLGTILCACGGSSGVGADDTGADGGFSTDSATTADGDGGSSTTACSPDVQRLILRGAFEARSTALMAWLDQGRVLGGAGPDEAGRLMLLRRDGDVSEAAFTVPGTFDVSKYPNNIYAVRGHVSGETFAEGF